MERGGEDYIIVLPLQLLVKKSYGDKKKCHKQRNWYLQSLNKEQSTAMDEVAYEKDYYDFLEDLEEDRQFRQHVNIYKSKEERWCFLVPRPIL